MIEIEFFLGIEAERFGSITGIVTAGNPRKFPAIWYRTNAAERKKKLNFMALNIIKSIVCFQISKV